MRVSWPNNSLQPNLAKGRSLRLRGASARAENPPDQRGGLGQGFLSSSGVVPVAGSQLYAPVSFPCSAYGRGVFAHTLSLGLFPDSDVSGWSVNSVSCSTPAS